MYVLNDLKRAKEKIWILESWNLRKITKALEESNVDNVKIEVPMFQRNLVWSEEQKKTFIDSVKKVFQSAHFYFTKLRIKIHIL